MLATFALVTALVTNTQKDRADIDALCKQIAKATSTRDWKTLRACSTKDFKQYQLNGPAISLNQLISGFDNFMKQMTERKCTYKILSFKSDGKTATATMYWSIFGNQSDPMGRKHLFELSDREIDVFKKVNGKWLEASVKELEDVQKVDGKLQGGEEI